MANNKTVKINTSWTNVKYRAEKTDDGSIIQPQVVGESNMPVTARIEVQPRKIGESTNGRCLQMKYQVPLKELSRAIGSMYCSTFAECQGALVVFNQISKKFELELVFVPSGAEPEKGKIKNIKSLVDTRGKNVIQQLNNVDRIKSGNVITLNDETRLLLAPECYGGIAKNKNMKGGQWDSNWIKCEYMTQSTIPNYGTVRPIFGQQNSSPFIKFRGLDLLLVIKKLYGRSMATSITEEQDGSVVNYEEVDYRVHYERYDPVLMDEILTIVLDNKALRGALASRLMGGYQPNGAYVAYR